MDFTDVLLNGDGDMKYNVFIFMVLAIAVYVHYLQCFMNTNFNTAIYLY